jgi:septin 7
MGKSTLINTLFNTGLYAKKEVPAPHQERPTTVAIESITAGKSVHGRALRVTSVVGFQ